MSPHVVATAAKQIAPQPPPAQPAAPSAIDFSQLLDGTSFPLPQIASSTPAPQAPWWQTHQPKPANSDANSTAAATSLAGAASVTTPQSQQTAQNTNQTTTQTTSTPAPTTAAPSVMLPLLPPSPAQVPAAGASSGPGNGTGQGAQTAPGAAEVEARIVAGAPNYVSQPSTMLADLWHHPGAASANAGSQSDDTPSGATANSDSSSASSADASAAQTKLPSVPDSATLAAHGASSSDASGAHAPDGLPAQAAATATTAASTDPTAATVVVQTADGHQTLAATTASSTNAGAAPVPTPVHILPAAEQVALSLRQAAQNNTDRIEIQLKPASLGAIAVKLDVTHDGHISAVITADRSDTLNLLKQDSQGLQQALRDAGLKADNGSLSFNLRGGDPQSYTQNQAPSTGSQRYSEAAAAPSSSQTALQPILRRHDGTLDIEV